MDQVLVAPTWRMLIRFFTPNFIGRNSFVQTVVPGLLRIMHVTVSRILLVSSHVQQCPVIIATAAMTSVAEGK